MVKTILLADGIYVAARRLATLTGFALSDAQNVAASRLTGSLGRLDSAVEQAVAADQADSWVLIDELQALFREGPFGYWPGRQDFERQGEEKIAFFRQQLEPVRSLVSAVQTQSGSVPGKLEGDADDWDAAVTTVEGVNTRIDKVRAIPGWAGSASGGYARRNMVQDAATRELRGMAKSMSNALRQIALFNRALFLYMDEEIIAATAGIKALKKSPSGHFGRSINGARILMTLHRNLLEGQRAEPVHAIAEDLQAMVAECLESPQVLGPEWPSGGAQAGVAPAETDAVIDLDEDSRVEEGRGAEDGIRDGIER